MFNWRKKKYAVICSPEGEEVIIRNFDVAIWKDGVLRVVVGRSEVGVGMSKEEWKVLKGVWGNE